eukprot:TRINITY_DN7431_c0_g3_i1.p1 TRINITY_DN7431_c0_g3~~TRINITY_DN7431_c0_g3_i1.p1  ORF type:complete len:615 (-),score=102.15 TRINITY_DN7431_c0_g3_i1:372-2216(-)
MVEYDMDQGQLFYPDTRCVFGSKALATSIAASLAVCRVLSSTLGPRAMSKMLVDDQTGRVLVTSDGATILRYLKVSHPAASLLIDVALSQERTVCDGTKTVMILSGEILSMAQQLMYPSYPLGVHPMTIVQSLVSIVEDIGEILDNDKDEIVFSIEKNTQMLNTEKSTGLDFLSTLHDVALMSLGTKLSPKFANKIACMSVDTIMSVACNTLNYKEQTNWKDLKIDALKIMDIDHRIKIVSFPGGDIEQSKIVHGLVLQCEVLTSPFSSSPQKLCVVSFEVSQSIWMRSELSSIMTYEDWLPWFIQSLVKIGVTAFFTTKTVESFALQHFILNNIFVCQKVSHLDSTKLARCMRIIVAADPEHIVNSTKYESKTRQDRTVSRVVGTCKEITVEGSFVYIYLNHSETQQSESSENSNSKQSSDPIFLTLLLRGSSLDTIQEIQRSLFSALGSLRSLFLEKHTQNSEQGQESGVNSINSYKVVLGGGCTEISLALKLRQITEKMITESNSDKYSNIKDNSVHALITNKFAECLESITLAIAKNANVHPQRTIKRIQDAHKRGECMMGLDGVSGLLTNTYESKMFEPLSVKLHSITTAVEIVCAILRIDTIIQTPIG